MSREPVSRNLAAVETDEFELRRRRRAVLAVSTAGVFVGSLNSGIVSVAVPVIAPHFNFGFTGALWIQTSYLLVLSILLIPLGHLADRDGLVRFHLIGVGLLIVVSVAAALSPNGVALIVARGLQGGAAALIYTTGAAIVVSVIAVGAGFAGRGAEGLRGPSVVRERRHSAVCDGSTTCPRKTMCPDSRS